MKLVDVDRAREIIVLEVEESLVIPYDNDNMSTLGVLRVQSCLRVGRIITQVSLMRDMDQDRL